MVREPYVLGVIPARGGSKGVDRKNVRPLAGRPLIGHTIEAAQESALITRLVVTTENAEIASVARGYDCEVHDRHPSLAQDSTAMVPVVLDVLESAPDLDQIEIVVVLQPTTPFREPDDIDQAITLLHSGTADSIVSVYEVGECHPSRMYRLEKEHLYPFHPEPSSALRQDLEPLYHRNGAIYACRTELLRDQERLVGETPLAYVMPRERSINIDDPLDWQLAEMVARQRERTRTF